MEAVQLRVARPTNNLEAVIRFYTEGLGFEVIGSFTGHEGYDGAMLGMPGSSYHLEFTQHINKASLPNPSNENLLVFYYDDHNKYIRAVERFVNLNVLPVPPENPYWIGKSQTFEDPDNWRIVLFDGIYISD
ncbi:MAG: VOC family protein [Daejeonella sp.]|uniref:VOC family protein n=1 Tax=Daejeonella sp. TaxID=2805397 RepID=UPI0027375D84|nr:VOC family protein [Daejeonella sp.]MDP3466815.1 VOC family protein [Daejeonella sp.]